MPFIPMLHLILRHSNDYYHTQRKRQLEQEQKEKERLEKEQAEKQKEEALRKVPLKCQECERNAAYIPFCYEKKKMIEEISQEEKENCNIMEKIWQQRTEWKEIEWNDIHNILIKSLLHKMLENHEKEESEAEQDEITHLLEEYDRIQPKTRVWEWIAYLEYLKTIDMDKYFMLSTPEAHIDAMMIFEILQKDDSTPRKALPQQRKSQKEEWDIATRILVKNILLESRENEIAEFLLQDFEEIPKCFTPKELIEILKENNILPSKLEQQPKQLRK